FHPIRPRSRPRRRPERCLHHFVSHPAKEKGIGLVEVLDRVTMQVYVRGDCTMIAAPVQCDVDGVPKRSHFARVPPMVAAAGRLYPRCRIGPVCTASRAERGTLLSWSRSVSCPPALGAPEMYQEVPLSATISP